MHAGIGAAALAVEKANADPTLLPGRVLEYSFADSGCSSQQALKAMGELLNEEKSSCSSELSIAAVIGPGCSSACEVTSFLAGGQGVPQISWGCTASSLSDKKNHRLVRPCYLACPL